MTVALLVITDGRTECLQRTIESLPMLQGDITTRVMYDDTGDAEHRAWLRAEFPDFTHINAGPRQGFGGAIRAAWRYLADHVDEPFVFHLEQDFVLRRPVPLEALMHVLDTHPYLVQLALRRQPWNPEEQAAGGIVEQHPDDYQELTGPAGRWLEHRRFFTTNPSLYRRELVHGGWPDVEHSEGIFTHRLLADRDTRFGFWGARGSGEWVEHIGRERVGCGY